VEQGAEADPTSAAVACSLCMDCPVENPAGWIDGVSPGDSPGYGGDARDRPTGIKSLTRIVRHESMAHRLGPPDGKPPLAPDEVIARLREVFPYVTADEHDGAFVVAHVIRRFEQLHSPKEVAEYKRLLPMAINIVVADTPDFGETYLRFTAMPGQALLVTYRSARHEALGAALLERCAAVLGYQIGPA
jgi:hypothetical protein